jgi:hypothetical protein
MEILVQYWTPYPESLGTKAFWILGFWIFMQRNFKTDKINNTNYMLRYALSTKLYKIKILLFPDDYQKISFYTPKVPPNLYLLIVGDYILLEDWGACVFPKDVEH